MYKNVFKRYEIKYVLNNSQYEIIKKEIQNYMVPDEYGKSSISNIYFDTPNYILARHSIEGPIYKEKLRLRGYGNITDSSTVFIEIKKKYESIVYKRRINMEYGKAIDYLNNNLQNNSQISREIKYFINYYNGLRPSVFLSYDREAFYGIENDDFRITFDKNICFRNKDITLKNNYGTLLTSNDEIIMEIKSSTSIPLWLTKILTELRIKKASYSKYGNAYKYLYNKGELIYE